jgi:hypothetical protein
MEASQSRPGEQARGAIRCDMCGATFPSEAALRSHQARVHEEEMRPESGASEPRMPPAAEGGSGSNEGDDTEAKPTPPGRPGRGDEPMDEPMNEPEDAAPEESDRSRAPGSEGGDGDEGEPEASEPSEENVAPPRPRKSPKKDTSRAV